jgi:hypothetical protein
MKTEQIIKTLKEHNDWRRGVGKWDNGEKANYFETISAYELGQTIDAAIERLQTLEKERDQARQEAETFKEICGFRELRDSFLPWEKGNE